MVSSIPSDSSHIFCWIPSFLQSSLIPKGRDLMETSLLGIRAPRSLTLYILSGYGSQYLFFAVGGSFSDNGWMQHRWLRDNIILLLCSFSRTVFSLGPWPTSSRFLATQAVLVIGFHLMAWVLTQTRYLLATATSFALLLHPAGS